MKSQYTNHERREVVKAFIEINQKLIAKHLNLLNTKNSEPTEELSDKEKALLEIHSRTATASAGIQSLYEMINASEKQLDRLHEIDNKLYEYFAVNYVPTNSTHDPRKDFYQAMQIYVFNFAEGKTRTFWENMQKFASKTFENKIDNNIIKYRFPVIATSKTPDHPTKFAIGNNVEENVRGEMAMNPDYMDGKPTHRAAGLLYVTLHKLKDLQEAFNNHTAIDINRAIGLKKISGSGQSRISNQLECDFLGKMKGEVIAVIPIIYPHIRTGEKFNKDYHQAIWGINPNNSTKTGITNPTNILEGLKESQNPDVANTATFGKMLIPSIVNLANGIVLAATKAQKKYACSITADNNLIPYKLKFDHETSGAALTYMHRELTKTKTKTKATESPKKAWQEAVTPIKKKVSGNGEDFLIQAFEDLPDNSIEIQEANAAVNNNIATFNQKIEGEVTKPESKEEELQDFNQTPDNSSLIGDNNPATNEDQIN